MASLFPANVINARLVILFGLIGTTFSSCKDAESPVLAQLVTTPVSAITSFNAVSGGTIKDDGGIEVTARGIVWNITPNPTTESRMGQTVEGTGSGTFASILTGLTSSTTYYVRSYAMNAAGTAYGTQVSFTTLEPQLIVNSIGSELVFIPAGTFQMGSNDGDSDELPVHSTTISKGFWMGKYEVTQKEWVAVMGRNPSNWKGDNLPVEQVTWNEVQQFITALNTKEATTKYRLPTEAEWEYATRAGSTSMWSFGNTEAQLVNYAWYSANSEGKTQNVGQKLPNAFGLYDVHGNVWEWCQDWFGTYSSTAQSDPTGATTGSYRVIRGGDWSYGAQYVRSAYRFYDIPDLRYIFIGFRLVASE